MEKIESKLTNRTKSKSWTKLKIQKNTFSSINDSLCTLFEKSNFCPKIQFWQKPQHFHEFFTQNFFKKFSREIRVVNSKVVHNRRIFTNFYLLQFFNLRQPRIRGRIWGRGLDVIRSNHPQRKVKLHVFIFGLGRLRRSAIWVKVSWPFFIMNPIYNLTSLKVHVF